MNQELLLTYVSIGKLHCRLCSAIHSMARYLGCSTVLPAKAPFGSITFHSNIKTTLKGSVCRQRVGMEIHLSEAPPC